jgi:hypothetical protein
MSDSSPVEDPQADQQSITAVNRLFPRHCKALGLLIATNVVFRILIAGIRKAIIGKGLLYSDTIPDNMEMRYFLLEITENMEMGVVLLQPILFAFWAAFAPHRFFHRFLWAFFLCSSVSFIEEFWGFGNGRPGVESGMVFQLIFFALFTALLLLVRRFTGWHFKSSETEIIDNNYQANQFGIKHIIWLTIITGVTLSMIRTLMIRDIYGGALPGWEAIFGIALFFVLCLPIVITPWFTMSIRGNIIRLSAYAIIIIVITDFTGLIIILKTLIDKYGVRNYINELVWPMLFMQLGVFFPMLVNTIVLRLCGYRMIRERKTFLSS